MSSTGCTGKPVVDAVLDCDGVCDGVGATEDVVDPDVDCDAVWLGVCDCVGLCVGDSLAAQVTLRAYSATPR